MQGEKQVIENRRIGENLSLGLRGIEKGGQFFSPGGNFRSNSINNVPSTGL